MNSLQSPFLNARILLHEEVIREGGFHIEYLISSQGCREVNVVYGHQISGYYGGDYDGSFLSGCDDVYNSMHTRLHGVTS